IIFSIVLATVALFAFTGCSSNGQPTPTLTDGTYRAEFKDFDTHGWKDFVEVTVLDGELHQVVYDSLNSEKSVLKSEDESYKNQMESIIGTYPAKYNKDLINQFIESGKVSAVDIVAGATQSTGNFKTLMITAMESAQKGDTETKIVDNIITK
ncbi:MAG: hypothetical protein RR253_07665, partial [Oscillospiraceae bacterium]